MRTHPDEPDKKILDYLVPDAERSITPTGDRGLVRIQQPPDIRPPEYPNEAPMTSEAAAVVAPSRTVGVHCQLQMQTSPMDLLDVLALFRWSRPVRTATAIAFVVCCFVFREQLIAVVVSHGQDRAQEITDALLHGATAVPTMSP
jgi:hypothetical protein